MSGRAATGLLDAWARGEAVVGAACKVPSALAAESVAAAGFDYVYVDQQHGVFDNIELLAAFQAIAAAGAAPLTRVPANRPHLIHRGLDFGAVGIIVPLVESAADALEAVAACRYPPLGNRSYGVLRPRPASLGGLSKQDRPACIVLVETEKGINNLDAIARTDGVDAIMVGPQDLALSLGIELRGEWLRDPVLLAAIERIRLTCQEYGVVAGIGATNGTDAAGWLKQGFRLVNVGNDLAYIRDSLHRELVIARAALAASTRE